MLLLVLAINKIVVEINNNKLNIKGITDLIDEPHKGVGVFD